jgi:hypothetical protein
MYAEETKRRGANMNETISSPYKNNLVISLKRSNARKTRVTTRKQELCSENKESAKKTKKPKHKICLKMSMFQTSIEYQCMLRVSVTADNGGAECLFCTYPCS